MGGDQAAGVLSTVRQSALAAKGKEMTAEEVAEFEQPIKDKYEKEGSAYYSSARLWDDGIIAPEDTRKVLGYGLQVSLNKKLKNHTLVSLGCNDEIFKIFYRLSWCV